MQILIPTISIIVLTGIVWIANRIFSIRVCPICAGISGTWIWMLATFFLGYEINLFILGTLMGGSVVGITYQLEKRFLIGKILHNKLLIWKTVFMVSGFITAYALASSEWIAFSLSAAIITALSIFAVTQKSKVINKKQNKNVEQLEKYMEDCCE